MSTPRTVETSLRYGDCGARWGNLAAPSGAFAVGDEFAFAGEEGRRVVRRVLPFPTDPAKRLVHYEAAPD
ncbi:MAG TPA: hypothetical protein P5164_09325 [Thermoanaerobaculia bacterium]|nr:hypothetical protein [Thermoanaerobaculia bacterium]